jgi:hypothetical protein
LADLPFPAITAEVESKEIAKIEKNSFFILYIFCKKLLFDSVHNYPSSGGCQQSDNPDANRLSFTEGIFWLSDIIIIKSGISF